MFDDPARAADDLNQWAQNLERKAQQYQALHGRMAAMSVTETSEGGRVTVTVDGNGLPTDIRFSDGIRGLGPAALSAELMSCLHRAQATLRRDVTATVQEMVGEDEAGARIIGQYADRFTDEDEPEPEPPAPATPPGDLRGPDSDDPDDQYYRGKSWLV
ncbi:YbaB/EbfC family nucleoid-associated protein [Nocardia cyriacigeorgica]|uniref:YbaB/EbfC family nucleoid-associated protein n=1 Tax=Nocardia cyriacigeorgica TaxID=135487 RepID=A0A6P1DFC4_9NOCA|nr:YbaB/EbfC family nucleoid-associated protein [Nocardia cyriacigeorgica]NEW42591.1 YbaB/EbfC family nucleoid-associated protein [Nocardia cyriacigeorgica]NEW47293.1 YbaB/EbfC family nucleoid-associated protein [Nocardia cyriacigeorgica]